MIPQNRRTYNPQIVIFIIQVLIIQLKKSKVTIFIQILVYPTSINKKIIIIEIKSKFIFRIRLF